MKKLRIYLDTSVIGGCFDEEFAKYSNELIKEIKAKKKIAIISDLTISELGKAPVFVRDVLAGLPTNCVEMVEVSKEIAILAECYLKNQIVTPKYREDALHIAVATVNKIDVLVSWNFKHIVNLEKIKGFNAVNLKEGYQLLEIRSPMEVIDIE